MSKKTKPPAPEFEEGQKVWISKWALSYGIKSATFCRKRWSNVDYFFDLVVDGKEKSDYFFKKQFHATEEEARVAANAMRDKRIKSLQKQIAKLEQMKF